MEGVLFSVGDKKERANVSCFPHFLAEIVQAGTNHRRGVCHLEYVYYWVIHMHSHKHGGSVWNIFFHLFLSVIIHLSPPHPLLVERQWAVTDEIRNEHHYHSPTSPLHFNELCVPVHPSPDTPPELGCCPVQRKCCCSIPVTAAAGAPWRSLSCYSRGAFTSSFHR